jgi:hypothetical protein
MQRMLSIPGFTVTVPEQFGLRVGGKAVLVVPQYYAALPIVKVDDGDLAVIASNTGYSRKRVEDDVNDVLLIGWKQQLKWFVRYWVRWYYKSFPELARPDGTMLGFDASKLARYYWPGEKTAGKRKNYLREELHKWAEKATIELEESIQDMLATQD